MANYYVGFKRIWIIIWLATSLAVFQITTVDLKPSVWSPLEVIHPDGTPIPDRHALTLNDDNPYLPDGPRKSDCELMTIFRTNMECTEEQLTEKKEIALKWDEAEERWKADSKRAFLYGHYWKNIFTGLKMFAAWTIILWGIWLALVWIVRGFRS